MTVTFFGPIRSRLGIERISGPLNQNYSPRYTRLIIDESAESPAIDAAVDRMTD